MTSFLKHRKRRKPAYKRSINETKIALALFVLLVLFILIVRYFF
jgi:hypothetical protein